MGYTRVGCWCCPNNGAWSEFLSKVHLYERYVHWHDILLEFAKKIGAQIQNDKIVVNENMETTVKGLYACGDCTGGLYQISKAVYEGTKAGIQVIKYLKNNK